MDNSTNHDARASTPRPVTADLLPDDDQVETPEGELATKAPVPLSKNATKRAAKAERYAAQKLERRAREKEAKKQKKRDRAAKRAAGELDDDDELVRKQKRQKVDFGGTVVIDLGFDDKMTEKEISSLCSQLAYTYSANRNASFPFSLVFTSLNGRTFSRLESMNDASYKRWACTEWWQEGYERLWKAQTIENSIAIPSDIKAPLNPVEVVNGQVANDDVAGSLRGGSRDGVAEVQKKTVYLTADSPDELTELSSDEVYIIGGICDHNRYKNLCLEKGKESGIRTACLPIGRYLASFPTRKVLTVNQVFEILIKWVETKDWELALYSVIPKRKLQTGEKSNHSTDAV